MESSLSYFDLAEDDYAFLIHDYKSGRVGNILCSSAQNICGGYLKFVIDRECGQIDISDISRKHSLKALRSFIRKNVQDFKCDWDIVMKADGYYYSTKYPGDDTFIVSKDDVDECWCAVQYLRGFILERYGLNDMNEMNVFN